MNPRTLAQGQGFRVESCRVDPDLTDAGAAPVWSQLDKQALESCVGICALALSVVLAGSGNLDTLRLLRGAGRLSPKP